MVTLDGLKGVVLRSNSVQALAMALHELTTNAVKYGALGQRSGRLHVRWRVQAENGSLDPC
jgi:two-component sensor histidine kinase